MPKIKNQSDLKILLVIYRHTFGFTKGVDDKGQVIFNENFYITTRGLAEKTGMAQPNIVAGLNRLLAQGFIVKVKKGNKHGYKLKIQGEEPTQES
jgi:DNA-binding transcriptional regulator PaaX